MLHRESDHLAGHVACDLPKDQGTPSLSQGQGHAFMDEAQQSFFFVKGKIC